MYKNRSHIKINYKRFATLILCVVFLTAFLSLSISIIQHPEMYMPTWKYQLQNDIKDGDVQAINYYNDHYVKNGISLFGDTTTAEESDSILDLATVIDFAATENGVMLYTNDGQGYYIEK